MENKTNSKRTSPKNNNKLVKKLKINGWKWAFFLLLALVLGSGLFISYRIFTLREPEYHEVTDSVGQGDPVLKISSNKQQVNQIIDFYLSEQLKDSDIKYQFVLENEAMLTGEFKILNFPVTLYLYFDPYVMENGNVQLRVTNLSMGSLNLPLKEVMKLVKNSFDLPKWVEIDTKEESVMICLDQFQMQNGLFIKANRINLLDDEIQFSLYLPSEEKNSTDTTKN